MAETLGRGPCPVCRAEAVCKGTARGLAMVWCDTCEAQIFARGKRADQLLRASMVPAAVPHPPPVPAAAPGPAPAPAPKPRRSFDPAEL